MKEILQNFEQDVNDDFTINTVKTNSKSNIDKFNEKFNKIDELTLKKQFYRLNEIQKINKLQEYFKNIKNINDDTINTSLATNILELISNKKLKNSDIEYNIENTIINNIKNIEITDNKIEINVSKKSTVNKTLKKKNKE